MADTPTPSTPTTLAPVPGQSTSSADTSNSSANVAANASNSNAASTTNSFAIPPSGTGTIYTKSITAPVSTPAANIPTSLASSTVAGGPGPKGDKGDTGAVGPAGPAGPAGVVDYTLVQAMIDAAIAKALNLKTFKYQDGDPTVVFGGNSITLPTVLFDLIKQTSSVVTPSAYIVGDLNAGTITPQGVFTAAAVTADKSVTITANYVDSAQVAYTATTVITVKAFLPVSLSLTGPSTFNPGASATYALAVRYTDGSSQVVTSSTNTTWSLSTSTLGTLVANVLTGASIAAGGTSINGNVMAKYVEKGITLNASLPVTDVAPVVVGAKPFYGSAASPVTGFTDPATYSGWSTFVNALASRATNSTKDNVFTLTENPGQYGWYAYPKTYGLMTAAQIKGAGQPGPGGWDSARAPSGSTGATYYAGSGDSQNGGGPLTVSITVAGTTSDWYLYRTDQPAATSAFTETWTITG